MAFFPIKNTIVKNLHQLGCGNDISCIIMIHVIMA